MTEIGHNDKFVIVLLQIEVLEIRLFCYAKLIKQKIWITM